MSGTSARVAVAALAWLVASGLAAVPTVLAGDTAAADLLDRAREAAASETYTGWLRVEWRDGPRARRAEVAVRSAGGVMRLGDDVVGTGPRRLVRGEDGWLTLWSHDVIALGPSPAAKYAMSVAPGPVVAARATDMVEVRLRGAERPRERLYVDRESGLLLRWELLDSRERPYRSVGFVSISPTATTAPAPARSVRREPGPAEHVDPPYEAPDRLGSGYRLVGAYDKPGDLIHLFYSDGLHALSVFEQRGRLKTASLPAGAKRMELAGHAVRAYSTSVGETVVWEGDGVVYTVVSDAPWADVAAAVDDLPHSERPKRLRRVAETVVSLFRWR